jgi:hypothetical protein
LISPVPKLGFKKGLDKIRGKIEPYYAEGYVYLNMDERYRRTNAHSLPWDKPKVIVNRAIISRGSWRIVGVPDGNGLVCRENFIAIWPKANITIEVISALINSSLVNAALYVRGGKRLNQNYMLEQIPIPFPEAIDTEKITHLVINYANLRSRIEDSGNQQIIQECIRTLMQIDGLILKAYDLPPRLERKLLEFFRGYHRRPLPFDFPDYYPNPDKPEIGNIKIENLKVKLRRLYNAMISQKNWLASHFTFSFFILIFDIYSPLIKFFCHFCTNFTIKELRTLAPVFHCTIISRWI